MKILILANNQQNIDVIRAEISSIIPSDSKVHEVSDVTNCTYFNGSGTIDWVTDDPKNKVYETEYTLVFIWHRLVANSFPSFLREKDKSYVGLYTEAFEF